MNEHQKIEKAFSVLHASPNTLEEVLNMTENNASPIHAFRPAKMVLVAAVLVLVLATTAFAADYIINQREIFFFDSLEAMALLQREHNNKNEALSYTAPGTAEENKNMETVPEHVALSMEVGYYWDETILSDESDNSEDTPWEHRKVTQWQDEDYGSLSTEYLAGSGYAQRLVIPGHIDWDISAALADFIPEQEGQLVVVSRKTNSDQIMMVQSLLGYTTAEGKRFQIEYDYDAGSRYLSEKEFILSSGYDYCAIYTTPDQVEVLIQEFDGQIWAEAVNVESGNAFRIYTTGCTVAEIENILDRIELSLPMNAGK